MAGLNLKLLNLLLKAVQRIQVLHNLIEKDCASRPLGGEEHPNTLLDLEAS